MFEQLMTLPTSAQGRLIVSFKSFLSAAGPLLAPPRKTAPGPVHVEAISNLLLDLRPYVESQRSNGHFLNVWTTAGLRRDEVKIASVLAALLDANRLGDLSRAFLHSLISGLRAEFPALNLFDVAEPYSILTEVCPLGNRNTRIDLMIEAPQVLIGIEIKIDATERPNQLADYLSILKGKAKHLDKTPQLIYLSRRVPSSPAVEVAHLSWDDVQAAARRSAREKRDLHRAAWLLEQFADHVANF